MIITAVGIYRLLQILREISTKLRSSSMVSNVVLPLKLCSYTAIR